MGVQSQATTVGRSIQMLSVFSNVRSVVVLLTNPFYKSLPAIVLQFSFRTDGHLSSYVFQILRPHQLHFPQGEQSVRLFLKPCLTNSF